MNTTMKKKIALCALVVILAAVAVAAVIVERNHTRDAYSEKAYPLAQETKDGLLTALDTLHEQPQKYLELPYFTQTEAKETAVRFEKDIRTDDYFGLLTVIVYPLSQKEESTLTHKLNGEYLYSQAADKTAQNAWSFHYFDGQSYVNIDLYGKNEETNTAQTELEEFIKVILNT